MKWFLETTVWDNNTPNHAYLLSDSKSKMYAYAIDSGSVVKKFSEPIQFNIKGRKFLEVPNTWDFMMAEPKPVGRSWQVAGSKGNAYTVSEANGIWSCSCSGFMFRGKCKHVAEKSVVVVN